MRSKGTGTTKYEIERRAQRNGLPCYAIMRTGPKGGTRLVAVWDNQPTALAICQLLTAGVPKEL